MAFHSDAAAAAAGGTGSDASVIAVSFGFGIQNARFVHDVAAIKYFGLNLTIPTGPACPFHVHVGAPVSVFHT